MYLILFEDICNCPCLLYVHANGHRDRPPNPPRRGWGEDRRGEQERSPSIAGASLLRTSWLQPHRLHHYCPDPDLPTLDQRAPQKRKRPSFKANPPSSPPSSFAKCRVQSSFPAPLLSAPIISSSHVSPLLCHCLRLCLPAASSSNSSASTYALRTRQHTVTTRPILLLAPRRGEAPLLGAGPPSTPATPPSRSARRR